jgi:hypothetical protein
MFFVLLAVTLFTFVVGQLLVPRPKGGATANLNAVSPPTAEKGTPIPVVFGTCKIAPNVTWYGNVRADPIDERIKLNIFNQGKHITKGYRYGADISGVLCHGPIDELVDLWFQDTSMLRYNQANTNYVIGPSGSPVLVTPMVPGFPQLLPGSDNPVSFTINAPDIFGGDDQEGGVKATIQFFFGKLTQIASTVLADKLGAPVSRYKGICHFIVYNALFGTSPYLKAMYAVVRRCPLVVSVDAATANIGGSANPADVIYEMMTDPRWGLGLSPAKFDFASFRASAATFKAEDMGVDFVLASQDAASSAIDEVCRHCDCVVFSHPQTGLITLKLARADYVIGTLPHVNPSNAVKFDNYKRNTWPETYNEVRVTFLNRGVAPYLAFTDDVAPAQNLANLQATGQVASAPYSFPYFSSYSRALQAAFRTLRVVSVPLASGSLTLQRSLYNLTIGSVLVLDWPPLGISGLVMRCLDIKFGTLEDNSIEVTVVEDVFNTAPVIYTAPAPTAWTPPVTTPVAHIRALAVPTMYFLVRADQFIGMNLVVRGNLASVNWDGTYNNNPTVADSPVNGTVLTTNSPFCPAGTMLAIYPWNTAYQDEVGFLVSNLDGLDKLIGTDAAGLARGDQLALIAGPDGNEVISWRDIIPQSDGSYRINGILRGQFDTVPMDHKLGDTVYFFYPLGYTAYFPGQDASGAVPPAASAQTLPTSGYKLWPAVKGIASQLPPGPPVAVIAPPVTNIPTADPRRAVFPLPVGDTRLNSIKNNVINPASLLPDTNALSWVHRNRLLQTALVVHDAADVTIEATETYEVEVRHVNKTTGADSFGLLRVTAGQVSPYSYTNQMFEVDITAANGGVTVAAGDARRTGGGIRFLIRSVRGTLKSYDVTVPGFMRKQLAAYPIIPALQFLNIYTPPTVVGEPMDTSNLDGWYDANEPTNILTGTRLDTWKDLSGNGRDITRAVGTPTKTAFPAILGKSAIVFTGAEYFNNKIYHTEGSQTFFIVMKYDAIAAYHNIFDTLNTANPSSVLILWIKSDNSIEPDATGAPVGGNLSGVWALFVIHSDNFSGHLIYELRQNGVSLGSNVTAATGSIPGGIGTPANHEVTLFHRAASGDAFHGAVAEWGWYTRAKHGFLAFEATLMDKYGIIAMPADTDLVAWYDSVSSTSDLASHYTLINDKTGNGHDLSVTGTVSRVVNQINGRTIMDLSAVSNNYFGNLTIPIGGSMTFFIVCKYAALGGSGFQNMFDHVVADQPPLSFFAEPSGGLQSAGGESVAASWAAAYHTFVVHFANSGSPGILAKVRIDGVQRGTFLNTTASPPANVATIPGTPSVPVNQTFSAMNRQTGGPQYMFKGQVAEFGFFKVSKDGAEGPLETYLRNRYKTW